MATDCPTIPVVFTHSRNECPDETEERLILSALDMCVSRSF